MHTSSLISGSKQLKGTISKIFTDLQLRMTIIYLQEGDRINNQYFSTRKQVVYVCRWETSNLSCQTGTFKKQATIKLISFHCSLIFSLSHGFSAVWQLDFKSQMSELLTSTETHHRSGLYNRPILSTLINIKQGRCSLRECLFEVSSSNFRMISYCYEVNGDELLPRRCKGIKYLKEQGRVGQTKPHADLHVAIHRAYVEMLKD